MVISVLCLDIYRFSVRVPVFGTSTSVPVLVAIIMLALFVVLEVVGSGSGKW